MTAPPPTCLTPAVPRLWLWTWGRGEGLLGLLRHAPFGPRGGELTLLQAHGVAPQDLTTLGLHRVDLTQLQWRAEDARLAAWRQHPDLDPHLPCWSLVQEDDWGDFWADAAPRLRDRGWQMDALPGFAHHSQQLEGWHLGLEEEASAPRPLGLPRREGAWLLSLGVDVQGQRLDLAPLLADLLRREPRWRHADTVAQMDPGDTVRLRAPGGRRFEAPAGLIRTLIGQLLDLLDAPPRQDGHLRLHAGDLLRLDALLATPPQARPPWQVHDPHDLRQRAQGLAQLGHAQAAPAPAGLGVALRPYQAQGLGWLRRLRALGWGGILADDMGLGKTVQALAHLAAEHAGACTQPSLVVVPPTLLFHWQAQARSVAPGLRVWTWWGEHRRLRPADLAPYDLVLTTYSLLWRDLDHFKAQPWQVLVLDEAQSLKNPDSRAARAVRRLRYVQGLCLSGTPVENHLGELWALMDVAVPGFLGDARQFYRQWRKPIEVNGETQRARLLAQRIRPFVLRRHKQGVLTELPPVTEQVLWVELNTAERLWYESVRVAADTQVRRVLAQARPGHTPMGVLTALLRLRQVCADPRLVPGCPLGPGAKQRELMARLPDVLAGKGQVLVFSQFTRLLDGLEPLLAQAGLRWLRLDGRTPVSEREARVRDFQAGQAPLMLLSLKAGGLGLTLTAADTVVLLDPWWNPAVEAQALARAHRLGQTRPVTVYRLVVRGSIEARMLALQANKRHLADGVLGHGGPPPLAADDWLDLLAPLDPELGPAD